MIPFNLRLKVLIPGYRSKWRRHFRLMIEHLEQVATDLDFGEDQNVPWIEIVKTGYRFFGFWSGQKEFIELHLIGKALPEYISKRYYRLVKDYITRFLYPHMRPDLTPAGINLSNCGGFHGQHKEPLSSYQGAAAKDIEKYFRMKPDDVIINGGSYLGFGDLSQAEYLPLGHIFSIEADKDCYRLLKRNIEFNKIENVTPIHNALWNEETMLDLEVSSAQAKANTLLPEVFKGEKKQKVRTKTIDSFIEENGITKLDMVSLTLNGAEVETLQGSEKTLSEFKPRIRLAGWYRRDGIPIWKLAKDALEDKGYRVFVTPRGNVLAIPNESGL